MKEEKDEVWYAAYGSNLNRERFQCYINGGTPRGSKKEMQGARDDGSPRNEDIVPYGSTHELYFARYSKTWNGGVAFIREDDSRTLYRLYLLTTGQFKDVALQECGMDIGEGLEERILLKKEDHVFSDKSWYGKVVHLGDKEDRPIYTVTSPIDLIRRIEEPSMAYLYHISKGLISTYGMDKNGLLSYLETKKGMMGRSHIKKILDRIIKDLKDQ